MEVRVRRKIINKRQEQKKKKRKRHGFERKKTITYMVHKCHVSFFFFMHVFRFIHISNHNFFTNEFNDKKPARIVLKQTSNFKG